MIENLSSRPSLGHETLWRAMRELVDRVFGALESETVLDDCLDLLVDLLGADRGLVVITFADGTTKAVTPAGTSYACRDVCTVCRMTLGPRRA